MEDLFARIQQRLLPFILRWELCTSSYGTVNDKSIAATLTR